MLSLEQLRLKEMVLIQELELVRCQIKFVVSLKRDEQQKEFESPYSLLSKDSAIPEGTAPGKESTNPLKAIILPKDKTEVQTSTTLIKPSDLNLRPNGMGIRIPTKSGSSPVDEKSSEEISFPTNSKAYYVVFNGPNAGIYEAWNVADKASKGVPDVKYKKYKSFLEAKTSADIYCREKMLSPLRLISDADTLKPNTFAAALVKGKSKKVTIGLLPRNNVSPQDDNKKNDLRKSDFLYMYSAARQADEARFVDEHYFTTDNKYISYYNFCKNADPQQVLEAFECGLVRTIYPSSNLLEIKLFPKELRKAIKTFKTKVIKESDKDIFIKVQSTIPQWEDDVQIYSPHHFIQIGISKGEMYFPSKAMENKLEEVDLPKLSEKSIEKYFDKILGITGDDKIFVNYNDDKILMTSSSYKPLSKESEKAILSYRQGIMRAKAIGTHNPSFCQIVEKRSAKAGVTWKCRQCEENKAKGESDVPSTSTSSSSTMKE